VLPDLSRILKREGAGVKTSEEFCRLLLRKAHRKKRLYVLFMT